MSGNLNAVAFLTRTRRPGRIGLTDVLSWVWLIGGTLGVALAWLLADLISYFGIPMPPPPGMSQGYNGEIMLTSRLAVEAFVLARLPRRRPPFAKRMDKRDLPRRLEGHEVQVNNNENYRGQTQVQSVRTPSPWVAIPLLARLGGQTPASIKIRPSC